MPAAIEPLSAKRERGVVALTNYSFWREYRHHLSFAVTLTDSEGAFAYQVNGWGNLVRTIEAFTASVAHNGAGVRVKRDLCSTGYALVNGVNVRISPLGRK